MSTNRELDVPARGQNAICPVLSLAAQDEAGMQRMYYLWHLTLGQLYFDLTAIQDIATICND